MYIRLEPRDDDPRLASIRAALNELPAEEAPPLDWSRFRARLRHLRTAVEAPSLWKPAALVAASLVAVVAVALWNGVGAPVGSDPVAARAGASGVGATEPQWLRPDVAAGWLEALPSEPAIVRVDTHLAVTQLEDSIAWMDELITLERAGTAQPARLTALQRERSRLMDSLVRVRYAETLAAEMH